MRDQSPFGLHSSAGDWPGHGGGGGTKEEDQNCLGSLENPGADWEEKSLVCTAEEAKELSPMGAELGLKTDAQQSKVSP